MKLCSAGNLARGKGKSIFVTLAVGGIESDSEEEEVDGQGLILAGMLLSMITGI